MPGKITEKEAMDSLQSMFPDIDKGSIRRVLVKTKGNMERTVELLLEGFRGEGPLPGSQPQRNQMPSNQTNQYPMYQNNQPQNQFNNYRPQQQPQPVAPVYHTLTPDFLRFTLPPMYSGGNSYQQPQLNMQNQVNRDAQLAQQLQSRYYRRAIREQEQQQARSQRQTRPNKVQRNRTSGGIGSSTARPSNSGPSTSEAVKKRLSTMGAAAKKKLADFRKRFQSNNANNNDEDGEVEYQSLIGAEDDDELPTNQL
mmetsp:Transcript_13405/g.20243  ORF Transcript_13405/g.20243 Transcript_13405/m.20243 type:complete len:254 (+) Transcript_13405:35-796(+)